MFDLLIPFAMIGALNFFGGTLSEKIYRHFHNGKVRRVGFLTMFEEELIERDIRITGSEFIQNDSLTFNRSS